MSTKINKNKTIQADWWSKSFAGCVLGFTLAVALSGIFAWIGPGGIDAPTKVQFNMWMIAPLWMIVLSFSYLFQTGIKAIVWLTISNAVAFSVLMMIRNILA